MNYDDIVDVADLDCIYLSYDEPQKEEFWLKIKNMVPWAKRVDGVKGSDAAHKAAADASDTERFILIDGDNLPDERFFNLTLEYHNEEWEQAVYRWRAKNNINGLMYGNGGLKLWPKEYVLNMQTHENAPADDPNAQVDFCWNINYVQMNNVYSDVYANGSAYQAYRGGFREGVKMCLDRGTKPTLQEFEQRVHHRNYDHLCIWQSVGADVENGFWAMYGARLGCYLTNLRRDWDFTLVRDFEWHTQYWKEEIAPRFAGGNDHHHENSLVSHRFGPVAECYETKLSRVNACLLKPQHPPLVSTSSIT